MTAAPLGIKVRLKFNFPFFLSLPVPARIIAYPSPGEDCQVAKDQTVACNLVEPENEVSTHPWGSGS